MLSALAVFVNVGNNGGEKEQAFKFADFEKVFDGTERDSTERWVENTYPGSSGTRSNPKFYSGAMATTAQCHYRLVYTETCIDFSTQEPVFTWVGICRVGITSRGCPDSIILCSKYWERVKVSPRGRKEYEKQLHGPTTHTHASGNRHSHVNKTPGRYPRGQP
jgi:hypothetical protein